MDIKEKTVNRAITMLKALGAEFHIKVGDDVYGQEIKPAARKRSANKYAPNALSDHMKSQVVNMNVGDVIEIVVHPFDAHSVQSCASAIANKTFGSGNYTTHVNDGKLEMLRLA